jgi:hypothetical protein
MGQAGGLKPVATDLYVGDNTWSRASARVIFHLPAVSMWRRIENLEPKGAANRYYHR